jgi:NADH-quinone oxidoreductase subunit L
MSRLTFLTFFGGQERWRSYAPAHAHGHESHDLHAHADHVHEDEHGFFYTSEELEGAEEEHAHHHELDANHTPHEVPPSMSVTLIVLAVLSVVGGYALVTNHGLQNWLYPDGLAYLGAEVVEGHPHGWVGQALLYLSIAAAAIGIGYGYLVYRRGLPKTEGDESTWHPFRRSAGEQFGYDAAMMEASVEGGGQVGKFLWKDFDAGFVDGVVNGIAFLFGQFGRLFRVLQTGYARTYALLMLIGGVGLLGWFWYASNKAEKAPITTPAAIAAPEGGERL